MDLRGFVCFSRIVKIIMETYKCQARSVLELFCHHYMLLLLIPCFSKQVIPSSFIRKECRRTDFLIFVLLNWMGFCLAVAVQFSFCAEREEACVTITLTLRYCSIVKKTGFLAFSRLCEACEMGKYIGVFQYCFRMAS